MGGVARTQMDRSLAGYGLQLGICMHILGAIMYDTKGRGTVPTRTQRSMPQSQRQQRRRAFCVSFMTKHGPHHEAS